MATFFIRPDAVPAHGHTASFHRRPRGRHRATWRRFTIVPVGGAFLALAGLATLATLQVSGYLRDLHEERAASRARSRWAAARHRPTRGGVVGRTVSALLAWAGLAALALGVLRRSPRGRRLLATSLGATSLVVSLVALTACGVVLLGESSLHLPGARRAHALSARLPLPWHHQVPLHLPPPEGASPSPDALNRVLAPSSSRADVGSDGEELGAGLVARASTPAITIAPAPAAVKLDGFRHQWQTWNNCGPATITMAMSHFGRKETQAQAAAVLKPNPNDPNVNPHELVAYVRSLGLDATWRIGGDLARLKLLLANGVPVLVEIWYAPEPNDWMGHYRLLIGYDDVGGRFLAYDAYASPGVDMVVPYDRFDTQWRVFDRMYLPVYRPEQAAAVASMLGPDADDRVMYGRALTAAQAEAAAQPNDAFAWFDVGTNLVALGRTDEAAAAFDRARALQLPRRMLWYQFGPFEAYLQEGRLDDVLALANANLQQTPNLEESHYYRGRALQAQGQVGAARAAYQAALRANPSYQPAYYGLSTLS